MTFSQDSLRKTDLDLDTKLKINPSKLGAKMGSKQSQKNIRLKSNLSS